MFKWLSLFILSLLLLAYPQEGMFGTDGAPQDTTILIANAAADSAITRTMTFSYDYETFEGAAGIVAAVYSAGGLSATVYIYGRIWDGYANSGQNLYTPWLLLDSLTSTNASTVNYTTGASTTIKTKKVDLAVTRTGWVWQAPLRGFQAYYKFTPGGADSAHVLSKFDYKKRQR